MTDLAQIFDALTPPREEDTGEGPVFRAMPAGTADRYWVGKTHTGDPALLIALDAGAPVHGSVPVLLRYVHVQHAIRCKVTTPNGQARVKRLTTVTCLNADNTLRASFWRIAESLIAMLGASPSPPAIDGAIARLVEVLKALTQPPRETMQGLWAELLLIADATDPAELVRCWHRAPDDTYDFNAGHQRIEVKSTSGRARRHRFALDQLQPPPGTRLVVASFLVERAGGGTSIEELAREIYSRIGAQPDLSLRVEEVVAQTLGDSWPDAASERFDRQLAARSLLFFRSEDIPSISEVLPTAISDVHFIADLTGISPIDVDEMGTWGGLLQAVTQR